MLDRQIIRISQVLDMEKVFYLFHTFRRQHNLFVFFIYKEISVFLDILIHQNVHLGKFSIGTSSFHLTCQDITGTVKFCGLIALSGNDQRSSRLIDQYRVNLIHNGIMQIPLNQILLINHHVISQIIKSKFVIGNVSDITLISRPSRVIVHVIGHNADTEPQEVMHLSHPLGITGCQIVVDRNDVDAFSLQGI